MCVAITIVGYPPKATILNTHIFRLESSAKSPALLDPIRAEMGPEASVRRGTKLPTVILKHWRR